MVREIKEGLNKWTDSPCSGTGRLSIDKMSILPRLVYRLSVIPANIPAATFAEMFKWMLRFMEMQGNHSNRKCLEKENRFEGRTPPDFKRSLQRALCFATQSPRDSGTEMDLDRDQWARTEPRNKP